MRDRLAKELVGETGIVPEASDRVGDVGVAGTFRSARHGKAWELGDSPSDTDALAGVDAAPCQHSSKDRASRSTGRGKRIMKLCVA
jgi:hypothetical protein